MIYIFKDGGAKQSLGFCGRQLYFLRFIGFFHTICYHPALVIAREVFVAWDLLISALAHTFSVCTCIHFALACRYIQNIGGYNHLLVADTKLSHVACIGS